MKKIIYLFSIIFLTAIHSYGAKQTVQVANFSFTPASFTINLGDTIVWVYVSGTHTTTSLTVPAGAATWNAPVNSSITSFSYKPTATGVYTYQCNFHPTMIGTFTVSGCPPVSGQVSATGATTVCKPASVTINCFATAGANIQWQKNGTNISGATGSSYNATATGSYRVMLSNNCGSTFTTNAIAVTVNAQPTATITTTGPTTYCKGTTPLTLTGNAGAFTYKWKKGSNYISGATAIDYQPTASGTYRVEVTNANGCTKLSAGVAVTVNPQPTATITPQGPTTFCAGGSVVLQANSGAGLTYQWRKGSNNINGATLQNYTATLAGTYRVIVTNANGCTKSSAGTVVTINCREPGELHSSVFSMELHPNPASSLIKINFESLDQYATARIINVTGQVLIEKKMQSGDHVFEHQFDISNLSAGVYTMLLETESGLVRKLFVKE